MSLNRIGRSTLGVFVRSALGVKTRGGSAEILLLVTPDATHAFLYVVKRSDFSQVSVSDVSYLKANYGSGLTNSGLFGLSYDGQYAWCGIRGNAHISVSFPPNVFNQLFKIRASDGTLITDFNPDPNFPNQTFFTRGTGIDNKDSSNKIFVSASTNDGSNLEILSTMKDSGVVQSQILIDNFNRTLHHNSWGEEVYFNSSASNRLVEVRQSSDFLTVLRSATPRAASSIVGLSGDASSIYVAYLDRHILELDASDLSIKRDSGVLTSFGAANSWRGMAGAFG